MLVYDLLVNTYSAAAGPAAGGSAAADYHCGASVYDLPVSYL